MATDSVTKIQPQTLRHTGSGDIIAEEPESNVDVSSSPNKQKVYPNVQGTNIVVKELYKDKKLDARNLDQEQETMEYDMISQLFDYN